MTKEKFKVMIRHYFESQDGQDYADDPVSERLHDTYADAKREIIWLHDDPKLLGESFWIKKVEVEA